VILADPFVGPPARGWDHVSAALEYASSNFRDGQVTAFEPSPASLGRTSPQCSKSSAGNRVGGRQSMTGSTSLGISVGASPRVKNPPSPIVLGRSVGGARGFPPSTPPLTEPEDRASNDTTDASATRVLGRSDGDSRLRSVCGAGWASASAGSVRGTGEGGNPWPADRPARRKWRSWTP
jgi:hypothetical protein